jgi:hypothetical protein
MTMFPGEERGFAGGGGGGSWVSIGGSDSYNAGAGCCGGGNGSNGANYSASAGEQNTGGGGGGGGNYGNNSEWLGANGASGIFMLRYPATQSPPVSTTGNPLIRYAGGYQIYIWTTSGSVTF